MNYNELIERLEEWNEVCISEMCADDKLTCDDLCGNGDCIVVQAGKAIKELMAELSEERHRHDRLQDYEVAQAQELERVKAERDAAISEFRGFCSKCDCAGKRYLSDGQPDARCVTCIANNKCNWKWRGPQKEA